MGKIKDLTGQKFNKLTVIKDTGKRKNRQVVWLCQCECGKYTEVVGQALRTNHTKSCGCLNHEKEIDDLTNQKFNGLLVLSRYGSNENRQALWKCKCDCGNEAIVSGTDLKHNNKKTCGKCKNILFYKKHQDIIGKKFGLLTVIDKTEYRDSAGRILWRCNCECGNSNLLFSSLSLKSGNTRSCGCMRHKSLAEEAIEKCFKENNIKYIKQFSFEHLKSPKNYPLRFDFAILDENNSIMKLIEYDGIQHFIPIDYYGGVEQFKYQKECDALKDAYCLKNNYQLIRFPYTKKHFSLEDFQ